MNVLIMDTESYGHRFTAGTFPCNTSTCRSREPVKMAASMSTKFIQQYLNTSRRIVSQSAGTSYAYVLHIQNSSTKSQQAPIDYCVDLVK